MKITPLDIHHKKFKTGFKGYNVDEVDQFLDEISSQLDVLFKENTSMKEQVNESAGLVNKYKDLEGALNSALVNAQKLAEDVVAKASAEAEQIVKEAKKEAKEIFETSVEQRNELMQSIKRLEKLDTDSRANLTKTLEEFRRLINEAEEAVDERQIKAEEGLSERLDEFMADAAKDEAQAEEVAVAAEPVTETEIENATDVAGAPVEAEAEPVQAEINIAEPAAEPVSAPVIEPALFEKPAETVAENNEPAVEPVQPPVVEQETISDVREEAVVNVEQGEDKVISINTENLVSNEEKSLLLAGNGHSAHEVEGDNPFADLGEGVPGAIRRKKKIND